MQTAQYKVTAANAAQAKTLRTEWLAGFNPTDGDTDREVVVLMTPLQAFQAERDGLCITPAPVLV